MIECQLQDIRINRHDGISTWQAMKVMKTSRGGRREGARKRQNMREGIKRGNG